MWNSYIDFISVERLFTTTFMNRPERKAIDDYINFIRELYVVILRTAARCQENRSGKKATIEHFAESVGDGS